MKEEGKPFIVDTLGESSSDHPAQDYKLLATPCSDVNIRKAQDIAMMYEDKRDRIELVASPHCTVIKRR